MLQTFLALGTGMGGVMLTFMLTSTVRACYVAGVSWVGNGDGWEDIDIHVNFNHHARYVADGLVWVWG